MSATKDFFMLEDHPALEPVDPAENEFAPAWRTTDPVVDTAAHPLHPSSPPEILDPEPVPHALTQLVREAEPAKPRGTLLAYQADDQIVTRDELARYDAPEPTRTHKPIRHDFLVDTIEDVLFHRGIEVVRSEFAVTKEGAQLFALFEINRESDEWRHVIAIRHGNDKKLRLQGVAGQNVFVCTNLSLAGEFLLFAKKHTANVDIRDLIEVAMGNLVRQIASVDAEIAQLKAVRVTEVQVKVAIYDAVIGGALPLPRKLLTPLHETFVSPPHEEYAEPTAWSLENAFTEVFKQLDPAQQFEAASRLRPFLRRQLRIGE